MRAIVMVAVLAAACDPPRQLVPTSSPDDVRDACALTQRKCSGCHELDRIITAHKTSNDWQSTVARMRTLPGSAISEHDASVILRCLVYVSGGPTPAPADP